jgi:hypothetical protein
MTDLVEDIGTNDTDAARSAEAQREAASGGGAAGEVGPGPFHDARRYRKRAQAAEKSLEDTRAELEKAKKTLAEHEKTIASLERREQIDALLRESDAIDFETARLLTELAVQRMSQPDTAAAVADLRRNKPYLFRAASHCGASGALAPKQGENASVKRDADRAATAAQQSGHRSDLLRYLRLRRRSA